MKQKQLYTRFRDWQRNPFHFRPSMTSSTRSYCVNA